MSASTVILARLNNSNIYTYNGKEFKVYIGVVYRVQCCGA